MNNYKDKKFLNIHDKGSKEWELIKETNSPKDLDYVEVHDHPEYIASEDIFMVQEVYTIIKRFTYKRK